MGNKQNSTSQATILMEKEKKEVLPQPKEKEAPIKNILDRNHFDFLYVIGRGGFGKVNKFLFYFIVYLIIISTKKTY